MVTQTSSLYTCNVFLTFTVLLLICDFSCLGIMQVFWSDLIHVSLFVHISKSKENSFNSAHFY